MPIPVEPDTRFTELRRTGDRDLRNQLVVDHQFLAERCVRRFQHRYGQDRADLVQVATVGLLKAVDRFDPGFGVKFSTFAMPTILGELRRHFRDKVWPVRVVRRVKDLYLETAAATERMSHELGRAPTIQELADAVGATVDDVLEALDAGATLRPDSLDQPDSSSPDGPVRGIQLADEDQELATALDRLAVRRLMADLPERHRQAVYLSYFEGHTQQQIGEKIGCSQVHVSRIVRDALGRMRDALEQEGLGPHPASPDTADHPLAEALSA